MQFLNTYREIARVAFNPTHPPVPCPLLPTVANIVNAKLILRGADTQISDALQLSRASSALQGLCGVAW